MLAQINFKSSSGSQYNAGTKIIPVCVPKLSQFWVHFPPPFFCPPVGVESVSERANQMLPSFLKSDFGYTSCLHFAYLPTSIFHAIPTPIFHAIPTPVFHTIPAPIFHTIPTLIFCIKPILFYPQPLFLQECVNVLGPVPSVRILITVQIL